MKPKTLLLTAVALITSFAAIAEGVLRTREVSPEEIGIAQATFSVGDSFSLAPFDDVVFTLNVSDALPGFAGRKAYAAHLGDGVRVATLSAGDNGAFDIEIRDIASARLYRLFCRDGLCTVEEIDLSHTGRGSCIEVEAPEIEIFEEEETPTTITKMSKKLLGAVPGNPFDDNVVAPAPVMVDIMLVFDNGARAWVENQSSYSGSITNFAIQQVAKMNSVLVNTGLHTNFWYRLVDVMTVDTTYTVVDNQILGIIKNGAESGDGPYGPIKERRAACGADLVSLMIDTGSAYGTTGIGYITHGTTYNTWLGYRAWCYSCCAIRSVDLEYTLSHEAGHNMGLAHSPTLAGWTKPGTFDYSNGFNFWGKDDNKPYHTIMAYDQDKNYSGYIEIPYFSSPDYTYQGTVIGTALSNDCTRALRETCAAFAAWHETAIPLPSDVTFSPAGSEAYRITLSTLGGYEIRYTTDGSEPTRESTLYTEPLTLKSGSVTVKAVAVVDDNTLGTVAEKTYFAAVELSEYAWLEAQSSTWAWGDWNDQDGKVLYSSYWNTSADKTAIIDIGGSIAVDRDIDLANLLVGGTTPMEIVTSDKSLHATNLHVIGQTVLAGTNYSFDNWKLHDESTLVLSPGEGNTVTLNKYLAQGATGSTLAITNGTFSVTKGANSGDGIATLQNCALRIDNGGILSLEPGWVLGYSNPNPVTVNKGGLLKINKLESTHRPLVLNGGNVDVNLTGRAYELRTVDVTAADDSTIADKTANGGARIYLIEGDSTFTVSDGKTLTVDISTEKEKGIIKKGQGEARFQRELFHTGTNTINAGTFTIAYNSSTTNCANWIVSSGATLKIEDGKSLAIPKLELATGAILDLPASATAPLAVSNSVNVAGVVIKLSGAADLSYGSSYPLITASDGFSGIVKVKKTSLPALAEGLDWLIAKNGNTLCATVVMSAEATPPVIVVGVDDSLDAEIPEDAVTSSDSVTIVSRPVLVEEINDTAVAFTLDVTLPETSSETERTICSWTIRDNNVLRCVQRADGVLDIFYNGNYHKDNITNSVTLTSGRHTIKIGYNYGDYGGTWAFVDDEPAYWSKDVKWSGKEVETLAIGATEEDTPQYPYKDLVLNGVGILKANSRLPLPNMTGTSGITYNYLIRNISPTNNIPSVFPNAIAGGFSMANSLLDASLPDTADSITVSIVASFPADKAGCLMGIWTLDTSKGSYITGQIDYSGDGAFTFSRNGYVNVGYYTLVNTPDATVDTPHLYTFKYLIDEGFEFYQDGSLILTATWGFVDKGYKVANRIDFGRGPWNKLTTGYDDNPNPISGFKVYASHIELGSDDRSVSEAAVMESLNFDSAYDAMTIAEKLAYLPANQTADGVAAPAEVPEEDLDPEPPATPATIDILVGYDNGAQAYVANKGVTLEKFAQEQIKKMNDVLVTNKLDRFYSYRLAGVCRVDATYSTVESVSANLVSGAGPLVTLRSARELCGADTVTLLVKASGGATLGDSIPLSHSTDVASRHDCAFSVCSISAVDTGAQHTMIHENAHNMGCGHARQQSAVNSPFEYGRGYYFMDGQTKRHTIMAYDVDGTGVYAHPSPYFSTTSKEFGFALGDSTNNNARVLKETCSEVAKWRESVVPGEDDVRAFDENGNEILSDCFFNGSLKVTVEAPVEGAELYYTFDGSEPTLDGATWHQTSPFTFNFTINRNLKIAYKSGETLSPVRTIRFTKTDNVPTNGLWQTCLKYPWTVEGDTIRSYNQTDYTYQCTTPLKATVVGPKRLSFSHKSYFGGATLGGDNYSHFDVLLDDSPVLAQTECTNDWTAAAIDIPDGTHEVTFVFSQRFAMNNPSDYKDLTPEADDAVWLKDIALEDVQTLECKHSSTSDDVSWVFPSSFEANAIGGHLGGIEVGSKGVVETLNFSTNAVVLSILAELPENGEGALMGLVDVRDTSRHPVYAYANGDGTVVIYFDDKVKTKSSKKSDMLDLSGLHVWTLAYDAESGARLYMDGEEVASDAGIMWTGVNNLYKPAEYVAFGCDCDNLYPLEGMKIYAVHSDFGSGSQIFDAVSSSVYNVLSLFSCLSDYTGETQEMKLALLSLYNELGYIPSKDNPATTAVLRISEIMPKPTDAQNRGALEGMDVNGLESGWVEVENTSDQWADLADYRFIRVNRGKKTDPAGFGNFPSRLVPPRSRAIFYTSERYSNSKSQKDSAFENGKFKGKPEIFKDYGNILVWGDKVNPKKSPFVRLYYMPNAATTNVVDTVVIPSDLPEGWSIIVGDAAEGEGTRRWMCPTPTRGRANTSTDRLKRIGPNAGPLYEISSLQKTDVANEFARPVPPAKPGEDYAITLPINPVMNPNGTFSPRTKDKIESIKLVYRKDLDDATLTTNVVTMTTKSTDKKAWGDQYTAAIPASYLPAAGHLIQWKVLITDGEGVEWTSPSFNNPDDGYEWYGTIVEAPELESATLPTWHMFAGRESLEQMDVDASDYTLANNARVAIYDSSTSNYYDYVRIDLRGNTSKNFTKKSHGLRFAKSHPLTMTDVVTGETIEGIRKTSLISEFADPSYMRQMIAFWLWRKMGNLVPFDFPVRCNLNGEFYQLAFNSERFTDELIEDVYGLDKFGYSYKNVGTMSAKGTTAGGIEKKTPDDENENDLSVLNDGLITPLNDNSTDLDKFVVEKFNLPAWINYLASARITQEMDDVWANVCAYYDDAEMKEGSRGTGTWMPLGYDFNLSFGQWYYNDVGGTRFGLMSNQDWFKSHPLYGGTAILCHKDETSSTTVGLAGNSGFEAIYQSAKFRRLYLRRLRTLMDQELKAPGTREGATPFMFEMRKLANLMRDDARLDGVWRQNDTKHTDSAIDVWGDNRPEDMDAGIDDIWENYVVPRRQHLYVTHSITNASWAVGYASDKNAGIPEAQSPFEALAVNITVDYSNLDHGVIVISNGNDEVVDMSGWTLKTGTEKKEAWTLPAGTVCDSNDCIYVVADRRKYISDHADKLTDQVIVGNATFGTAIPEEPLTYPETETSSGTVSISEEPVVFSAANDDEAAAWVESLTPQLTEEQIADKLTADKFTVVAKEVPGEPGKYQAVVDLNPVTVEKPKVDTSLEEPVEIEEDTEDPDKKKVSVSISNAIKGLWYGYEVSDELGEAADFANDVDSFERATGSAHKVKGSPRDKSKTSGFFRLKVLPAKPSKTSE
ncbi:MAG: CotH kinase family protein [Kiritimatiellae bacterium]|nr:CotH kinase family protein [Kiritimatiellia bacterium]